MLKKNDANPITLIEASFAKLPIITTRFAGYCNEIIVSNNGIVMNDINFDTFENAFEKCRLQVVEIQGEISFQNVVENFDINKVAYKLIEQLKTI